MLYSLKKMFSSAVGELILSVKKTSVLFPLSFENFVFSGGTLLYFNT